jgi:cell division transport system permease protein
MQLIGATRGFIRRPFLVQSAIHGLIAALVAMCLLSGMLYLIEKEFFLLFTFRNTNLLVLLALSLIVTGVIINIISTFFSVNRYLSISEDQLYY